MKKSKEELIIDIQKFCGLPPYGHSLCMSDGYFQKALQRDIANTKYTWDEIYLEANSKQEREDKMGMVRVKYNAEVYVTAHVPPADNKQELAEAALKAEIAINSIGTIPEGIHVRIHLNTE